MIIFRTALQDTVKFEGKKKKNKKQVETASEEASATLEKIEQEKPVAFSEVRVAGEDEFLKKAITEEDMWEANSDQSSKEKPQYLVPELSITVASPANNTADPLGPQLKADSLSLFSRYCFFLSYYLVCSTQLGRIKRKNIQTVMFCNHRVSAIPTQVRHLHQRISKMIARRGLL